MSRADSIQRSRDDCSVCAGVHVSGCVRQLNMVPAPSTSRVCHGAEHTLPQVPTATVLKNLSNLFTIIGDYYLYNKVQSTPLPNLQRDQPCHTAQHRPRAFRQAVGGWASMRVLTRQGAAVHERVRHLLDLGRGTQGPQSRVCDIQGAA